jgi:hypothetical protein
MGWVTKNLVSRALRASEGTLSRWSRLHLQSLAPTNPHWARVVGYGSFSLCVIQKEGLCPSSDDDDTNFASFLSRDYSFFTRTIHIYIGTDLHIQLQRRAKNVRNQKYT